MFARLVEIRSIIAVCGDFSLFFYVFTVGPSVDMSLMLVSVTLLHDYSGLRAGGADVKRQCFGY